MLRYLIERGLSLEKGILCIVDGSKGLRKPIDEVFGSWGKVQRCQWPKRENVVSYLPKSEQSEWLKRLHSAYQEPTYETARERLTGLPADLQ